MLAPIYTVDFAETGEIAVKLAEKKEYNTNRY